MAGRVEEGVEEVERGEQKGCVPCTILISQLVQRCVTSVLHHGVGTLYLGVDAGLGILVFVSIITPIPQFQ